MLLLAWAPVATANAMTCAIWCELNGGLSNHHAAAVHGGHDHGGVQQTKNGGTIADPSCSSPDLIVICAIAPDVLVAPTGIVSAAEPPVASPISLITAHAGSQTPPPRA